MRRSDVRCIGQGRVHTCKPTDLIAEQMSASGAASTAVGVGYCLRNDSMVSRTTTPPVVRLQVCASVSKLDVQRAASRQSSRLRQVQGAGSQTLKKSANSGSKCLTSAAPCAEHSKPGCSVHRQQAGCQKVSVHTNWRCSASAPAQQAAHEVLPWVGELLLYQVQRRRPAEVQDYVARPVMPATLGEAMWCPQ